MTLIIGIKCKDAVVLAADGAATYDVLGQSTIRQATKKKLRMIDAKLVTGTAGPVGLGQRFSGEIEQLWKTGQFSAGHNKAPPESFQVMTGLREVFWKHISFEGDVARASAIGPIAIQRMLSATVLAMQVAHKLRLYHFDALGAPEEITDDLPFVAIGSGQMIADPFLAFLKRLFWNNAPPTLGCGIFSAVWTLRHAIETHPGGVSDPMQVIKLYTDGGKPKAEELLAGELKEHEEAVGRIEKQISESLELGPIQDSSPPEPATAAVGR